MRSQISRAIALPDAHNLHTRSSTVPDTHLTYTEQVEVRQFVHPRQALSLSRQHVCPAERSENSPLRDESAAGCGSSLLSVTCWQHLHSRSGHEHQVVRGSRKQVRNRHLSRKCNTFQLAPPLPLHQFTCIYRPILGSTLLRFPKSTTLIKRHDSITLQV